MRKIYRYQIETILKNNNKENNGRFKSYCFEQKLDRL